MDALRGAGRGAALLAAGAIANGVALLALTREGADAALALALLPVLAIAFGRLLESDGVPLLVVALALPMSWSRLTEPLPVGGGNLYPSDIVVGVALAYWAASCARSPERRARVRWPDSPLLGAPLLLFAAAVVLALVRGHVRYGTTLPGQPSRLVLYAGIGILLGGLDARRLHRILTAVFYAGGIWLILNAVYYVATGTSQTEQVDLSTGGTRVLGISTSIYLAATLFLALLNLQLETEARRRLLHIAMAVVGGAGVLLGFGRAVFAATALVILLLLVLHRRVRASLLAPLPLALPALVLAGLLATRAAPQVEQAIVKRVASPVSSDANVQWRKEANAAIWSQVRESPLIGVGFGRGASFVLFDRGGARPPVPVRIAIGQDPHNGYVMLLAAGGVLLLGTFALLVVVYLYDCWRRFRGSLDPYERIVVLWAVGTLFVFLVNTASGTELESGFDLLAIWLLLLAPSVVPRRARPALAPPPRSPRRSRARHEGRAARLPNGGGRRGASVRDSLCGG